MSDTLPSVRRALARFAKKIPRARVTIRLFADERKSLEERARSVNKTLSSYLRDCALSPNACQSVDNPPPMQSNGESLSNSNEQEARQIFVHQSAENDSAGEKFSNSGGSLVEEGDPASERFGHRRGCACFACERLRAVLASNTTIDSGKAPSKERKIAKSKRINAV